jgi:hypothetical protein
MLAYLGTRPYGATPAHLADAFGITVGRARCRGVELVPIYAAEQYTFADTLGRGGDGATVKPRALGRPRLDG